MSETQQASPKRLAAADVKPAPLRADDVAAWDGAGRLYAVVDGEGAFAEAQRLRLDQRLHSVFANSKYEDAWAIAPYALAIENDTRDWALGRIKARGSGVLLTSDQPADEVFAHLARIAWVKAPNGRAWHLRYYDPYILPVALSQCTDQEFADFFGPVAAFIVHGDDLIYARPPDVPEPQPSDGPPPIRAERLPLFAAAADAKFKSAVRDHVVATFPDKVGAVDDAKLDARIDIYLARADALGLKERGDVLDFVNLAVEQDDFADPKPKPLPPQSDARGKPLVGKHALSSMYSYYFGADPRVGFMQSRRREMESMATGVMYGAGLGGAQQALRGDPRGAARDAARNMAFQSQLYSDYYAALAERNRARNVYGSMKTEIDAQRTRLNHARTTLRDERRRQYAIQREVDELRQAVRSQGREIAQLSGATDMRQDFLARRALLLRQSDVAGNTLRGARQRLIEQNAVVVQAQSAFAGARNDLQSSRARMRNFHHDTLTALDARIAAAHNRIVGANPAVRMAGPLGTYVQQATRPPALSQLVASRGVTLQGGAEAAMDLISGGPEQEPEPRPYGNGLLIHGDDAYYNKVACLLARLAQTDAGGAVLADLEGAGKPAHVLPSGEAGYVVAPVETGQGKPVEAAIWFNPDDAAPARSPDSDLFESLTIVAPLVRGEPSARSDMADAEDAAADLCDQLLALPEPAPVETEAADKAEPEDEETRAEAAPELGPAVPPQPARWRARRDALAAPAPGPEAAS